MRHIIYPMAMSLENQVRREFNVTGRQSLAELMRGVSLLLVNSNFAVDYPRPMPPNVKVSLPLPLPPPSLSLASFFYLTNTHTPPPLPATRIFLHPLDYKILVSLPYSQYACSFVDAVGGTAAGQARAAAAC